MVLTFLLPCSHKKKACFVLRTKIEQNGAGASWKKKKRSQQNNQFSTFMETIVATLKTFNELNKKDWSREKIFRKKG